MFELAEEIKERVLDMARGSVCYEIEFCGMPCEYGGLMEDRVYNNMFDDLKSLL